MMMVFSLGFMFLPDPAKPIASDGDVDGNRDVDGNGDCNGDAIQRNSEVSQKEEEPTFKEYLL